MNEVCFVYLFQDNNGFYYAKSNSTVSMLKSYLKKSGIHSAEYIEQDLPSLEEMADDILSVNEECIFIYIESNNFMISFALGKMLKALEENVNITFLFDDSADKNEAEKISIDGCNYLFTDFESNILKICGYEPREDNIITSEVSPYLDETVFIGKANEIGVCIGLKNNLKFFSRKIELINQELKSFKEYFNDKNTKIPLKGITVDEYSNSDSLSELLSQYDGQFVFEASLNGEKFSKIDTFPPNVRFHLIIENTDAIENINSNLRNNANRVASLICSSNIPVDTLEQLSKLAADNSIDVKYISRDGYWQVGNKKLLKFLSEKNLNIMSLAKGYLISKTGEYTSNVELNGFTKHITIDYTNLSKNVLQNISKFCSINSSLFVKNIPEDKLEKIENFKFHAGNGSHICLTNEFLSELYASYEEENCFPINLLYLKDGELYVNGIGSSKTSKLFEINYSEFTKPQNNIYYLFDISKKKDFEKFIADVDMFYETAKLDFSPLLHGQLKNTCRFGFKNLCSVTKVPRMLIGCEGNINPCYEEGETIGNIEDSYFDITQSGYVKYENNSRTKDCKDCKASLYCPRCSFLPEDLKDKYCDIMINKPYITDFLIESFVISALSVTNPLVSKIPVHNFKFSNEHFVNYLKEYKSGSEAPYFNKYVFIGISKNFNFMWSPASSKSYQVSKEIAVAAEALLMRIEPERIPEIIQKECRVPIDVANEIFTKSVSLFSKNSLLHRQVKIESLKS